MPISVQNTPDPSDATMHWCRCWGTFMMDHCDDCCRGTHDEDGTC